MRLSSQVSAATLIVSSLKSQQDLLILPLKEL